MEELAEFFIKVFSCGLQIIGAVICIFALIYGVMTAYHVIREANFFCAVVFIAAFIFILTPYVAMLQIMCSKN